MTYANFSSDVGPDPVRSWTCRPGRVWILSHLSDSGSVCQYFFVFESGLVCCWLHKYSLFPQKYYKSLQSFLKTLMQPVLWIRDIPYRYWYGSGSAPLK